jgi:hypothetical protein
LQSVNKEEFFLTLINELSLEFSDSLELSYYRCKLLYKINENEGIEEFRNIVLIYVYVVKQIIQQKTYIIYC